MKQLPVLPPSIYEKSSTISNSRPLSEWISLRVLELIYTAWDLESLAKDYGYNGSPFRWDKDRRFFIRCELDALFFHLYGISREDAEYILETFPIVKRKDISKYSEYRTKHIILECYDAMQKAKDSNQSYQT